MSLVEKALEKLRAATPIEPVVVPVRRLIAEAVATGTAPATQQSRSTGAAVAGAHLSGAVLDLDLPLLTEAGVIVPQAEAHRGASEYRPIKRSILTAAFGAQQTSPRDRRVVAVASALAGDGKTHTSVNLALSVARERDHVAVLVDADVEKADITRLLGLEDRLGLLDALASDEVDVCSLLRRANLPNLWILPAGRRAEFSGELVRSTRLGAICSRILAALPEAVVVLDSPPLLLTTEALEVASSAGQVVLVVKAGVTPQRAVTDAIAKVDDADRVRLVLNQADIAITSYYYYGRYGQ